MKFYSLIFSMFVSGLAWAAQSSSISPGPSNMPQTTLRWSSVKPNTATLYAPSVDALTFRSKITEAAIYQFDIEVPYWNIFNIGFTGLYMGGKADNYYNPLEPDTVSKNQPILYAGIGPFWRLQYSLLPRLTAFARADLTIGPFIVALAGLAAVPSMQVGGEFYLTEWFGLTVGYGKSFWYGIETLASNNEEFKKQNNNKRLRFRMDTDFVTIGLKTTYF